MKKMKLFLLLAVSATLVFGCGKKEPANTSAEEAYTDDVHGDEEADAAEEAPAEDDTEERVEKDGKIRSYLTGEWMPVEIANRRPVAFMLNNIKAGCPQSGIANAGVVYEAPVEGRITRLMAIIEDYDNLKKIGSMRSCRLYYPYLAMEYDAIYAHFGQAWYALELLNGDTLDNISGAVAGIDDPATNTYYRTSDRQAPHNCYASAEGLKKDIEKKGYRQEYKDDHDAKFKFAKDGEIMTYDEYPDATVLYPGGSEGGKKNGFSQVGSKFEYNEADRLYYRSQYGGKHIDELTGEQLTYTNVVFQYCDGNVLDAKDYLNFGVHGEGKVTVFTNGKQIDGTWERYGGDESPATYYDENGEEIVMNTGKTWVCIVWNDYKDDVEIQ